jgi:hypothetical protein
VACENRLMYAKRRGNCCGEMRAAGTAPWRVVSQWKGQMAVSRVLVSGINPVMRAVEGGEREL